MSLTLIPFIIVAIAFVATMIDGCKTRGEIDVSKIIMRANFYLYAICLLLYILIKGE